MQYANHVLHSDVYPAEVIRSVSDKTLVIRPMRAVMDQEWKPEVHAGGFSDHCSNNHEQRWIITSNPENEEIRIRLNKLGQWLCADGNEYRLSETPRRFYDFNF